METFVSYDGLAHSLESPESWQSFPGEADFPFLGPGPFPGPLPGVLGLGPSEHRSSDLRVGRANCCWRCSQHRLFSVQKLSAGTLKKLGLPQAKARHIPLHLHARQLVLPALGSREEELSLVCRLPRYFVRSLSRLGLKMPSQDQNRHDGAEHQGAQ